jgi:hypothetical protein
MAYADRMQKVLTGRTGDWIARRSRPWLVMLLAFLAACLSAFECSSMLLTLGVSGMAIRFALSFLAAYAAFLLILSAWFLLMPAIDARSLLDGAPQTIETTSPQDDDTDWEEQVRQAMQHVDAQDRAKALVGFLLIAAVLGALFVMLHWIRFARWYLAELLLLGGKVRHKVTRRLEVAPSFVVLLRQTIWIALTLLVHYSLIGLSLQLAFPLAATVVDVIGLVR